MNTGTSTCSRKVCYLLERPICSVSENSALIRQPENAGVLYSAWIVEHCEEDGRGLRTSDGRLGLPWTRQSSNVSKSAIFGFEPSAVLSRSSLDGWVVCEEYKDALVAAWEEEQAHAEEREREVWYSFSFLLVLID